MKHAFRQISIEGTLIGVDDNEPIIPGVEYSLKPTSMRYSYGFYFRGRFVTLFKGKEQFK